MSDSCQTDFKIIFVYLPYWCSIYSPKTARLLHSTSGLSGVSAYVFKFRSTLTQFSTHQRFWFSFFFSPSFSVTLCLPRKATIPHPAAVRGQHYNTWTHKGPQITAAVRLINSSEDKSTFQSISKDEQLSLGSHPIGKLIRESDVTRVLFFSKRSGLLSDSPLSELVSSEQL